jgi:hypothetical protein
MAVLLLRWPPEDRLFGIPVSLTRTDRRLDWARPARDLDDWLDSVDLWILEDVKQWVSSPRPPPSRRAVDEHIELSEPTWPDDRRFYLQVNESIHTETTLLEDLAVVGLDARTRLAAEAAGTLLAWTFAYENNSTGSPIMGHSTIIRDADGEIRLVEVVLGIDVPATVAVELVRAATHTAAEGETLAVVIAKSVAADLRHIHPDTLRITGFRPGAASGLRVETDFLAEDIELANKLLQAELAHPSRWGDNRDRAGRYLPKSQTSRLLHRLRDGKSGTPPRMYAG